MGFLNIAFLGIPKLDFFKGKPIWIFCREGQEGRMQVNGVGYTIPKDVRVLKREWGRKCSYRYIAIA